MTVKNVKLPPRNVGTNEVAYREALQTHMDNVIELYNSLLNFSITGSEGQVAITDNSDDLTKSFTISFPDVSVSGGVLIPSDTTATTPDEGTIRYNTGSEKLQVYTSAGWGDLGSVDKAVRYNTTSKNLEYDNSGTWTVVPDIRCAQFGFDSGPVLVETGTPPSLNAAFLDGFGEGYLGLRYQTTSDTLGTFQFLGQGSGFWGLYTFEYESSSRAGIGIFRPDKIQVFNDALNGGIEGNSAGATLELSGGFSSITVDGDTMTVPDYVFEPSYDLMPINAYEKYINENKHLPLLGDGRKYFKKETHQPLVSRLWETVENQALYIVELNKRLEKLEKQNIFKRILNMIKKLIGRSN